MSIFNDIATAAPRMPEFVLKETNEGRWILVPALQEEGKEVEFEICGSDTEYFRKLVLSRLERTMGVGILKIEGSEDPLRV